MCLAPVPSVTAGAGAASSHSRRAGGCGIQGERGGWRPAGCCVEEIEGPAPVGDRSAVLRRGHGWVPGPAPGLLATIQSGRAATKQVSSGDYDDTEPAWSPVESCWRSPRTARSATPTPRTLAAGKPRKIVHILNRVGEPLRFSPWRFSRYTCVLPSSPSAVLPRRKECQGRSHPATNADGQTPLPQRSTRCLPREVPRHHPYLRLVFVVLGARWR